MSGLSEKYKTDSKSLPSWELCGDRAAEKRISSCQLMTSQTKGGGINILDDDDDVDVDDDELSWSNNQ